MGVNKMSDILTNKIKINFKNTSKNNTQMKCNALRSLNEALVPATWKKYGEIFCDEMHQLIYVCAKCRSNFNDFELVFSTHIMNKLWQHIDREHRLLNDQDKEEQQVVIEDQQQQQQSLLNISEQNENEEKMACEQNKFWQYIEHNHISKKNQNEKLNSNGVIVQGQQSQLEMSESKIEDTIIISDDDDDDDDDDNGGGGNDDKDAAIAYNYIFNGENVPIDDDDFAVNIPSDGNKSDKILHCHTQSTIKSNMSNVQEMENDSMDIEMESTTTEFVKPISNTTAFAQSKDNKLIDNEFEKMTSNETSSHNEDHNVVENTTKHTTVHYEVIDDDTYAEIEKVLKKLDCKDGNDDHNDGNNSDIVNSKHINSECNNEFNDQSMQQHHEHQTVHGQEENEFTSEDTINDIPDVEYGKLYPLEANDDHNDVNNNHINLKNIKTECNNEFHEPSMQQHHEHQTVHGQEEYECTSEHTDNDIPDDALHQQHHEHQTVHGQEENEFTSEDTINDIPDVEYGTLYPLEANEDPNDGNNNHIINLKNIKIECNNEFNEQSMQQHHEHQTVHRQEENESTSEHTNNDIPDVEYGTLYPLEANDNNDGNNNDIINFKKIKTECNNEFNEQNMQHHHEHQTVHGQEENESTSEHTNNDIPDVEYGTLYPPETHKDLTRSSIESIASSDMSFSVAKEEYSEQQQPRQEHHFKCDKCEKSFVQFWQLNYHYRIHDQSKYRKRNLRPFKCVICSATTSSEKALRTHQLRFHQKEFHSETVVCNICMGLIHAKHLSEHMKKHNEQTINAIFKCIYCDSRFKSEKSLRRHKIKYHQPFNSYEMLSFWECINARKIKEMVTEPLMENAPIKTLPTYINTATKNTFINTSMVPQHTSQYYSNIAQQTRTRNT